MDINYKGSQGQTERAVVLKEEEEVSVMFLHCHFMGNLNVIKFLKTTFDRKVHKIQQNIKFYKHSEIRR
jgi:hypothetical protein